MGVLLGTWEKDFQEVQKRYRRRVSAPDAFRGEMATQSELSVPACILLFVPFGEDEPYPLIVGADIAQRPVVVVVSAGLQLEVVRD